MGGEEELRRLAPRLKSARCSVLWTSPFARHSDRLNDAAITAGDGKVVAHLPGAMQTVETPVLVSVHQV